MSGKTRKRIFLIYGICLSVLLLVSGALLAVSCYNIYKMGEHPFTAEAISGAFSKIQVIVYVTLGAILVGGALKIALPTEDTRLKAWRDSEVTLRKILSKNDVESCEKELIAPFVKLKKLRLALKAGVISLCSLASIPAIVVALIPASYTMESNQSITKLCYLIISSFLLCAALCVAYVILNEWLVEKQISVLKSLIADGKLEKRVDTTCSSCVRRKERYTVMYLRIAILALAVVFIALGIANDGMSAVLAKAINICTECIGLG